MDSIGRRSFIRRVAAAGAGLAVARREGLEASMINSSSKTAGPTTPSGLARPSFTPLRLGSIKAQGWLLRQLRLQAAGLSGHLDQFWPDVANSQWFGGDADGWERAPYWLDGVIPLAWTLDEPELKRRISGYIDHIVKNQRADGWYSPYPADADSKPYDLWAILLANKVLIQYHEATGEGKVLQAVQRNLEAVNRTLERTPLFNWGRFRWFEGLIPVFYVYELTREPWLLDLARRLREQGFDYQGFFEGEDVTVPTPRRGLWKWTKHVVNTAMAPKATALAWRLTGAETDRQFPSRMLELLDRYHGQVTGIFTGDECLAGKNPIQGTELCAVVELLYALEMLVSVFGDPSFADRLERVAYNALPATFTPDMWAHQYDQQVNQVQCTINPEHLFTTNGPESNIYGLEPNFGCCTANMHQGWPKFAAHLWMATAEEGVAAVAYAPSTAEFVSHGIPVTVSLDTEYPFRETLRLTVRTGAPVRFPLVLRVPVWAEGASLRVAGEEQRMNPGTFHSLDRDWSGTVEVDLRFPMRAKASRRYNDGVAIERGPLVYSLLIGENWTRVNADKPHRELPHGDFEVRPSSPWNYGLVIDDKAPERGLHFEERPVGEMPFSPEGAGMAARVRGRRLPRWQMNHGWAAEFAPGPHESSEPLEELTLIPYGCTNIRVTEFPVLKE
jgi:uncharacterized protein